MKLEGYRYLTNAEIKAIVKAIKRSDNPEDLSMFLYSLNTGYTAERLSKKLSDDSDDNSNYFISSKTLERKIKRWSEKAGLSNVTWNTLKYTYIVRARGEGVPFSEIATALGKSKAFTINVYRNLMMNGE